MESFHRQDTLLTPGCSEGAPNHRGMSTAATHPKGEVAGTTPYMRVVSFETVGSATPQQCRCSSIRTERSIRTSLSYMSQCTCGSFKRRIDCNTSEASQSTWDWETLHQQREEAMHSTKRSGEKDVQNKKRTDNAARKTPQQSARRGNASNRPRSANNQYMTALEKRVTARIKQAKAIQNQIHRLKTRCDTNITIREPPTKAIVSARYPTNAIHDKKGSATKYTTTSKNTHRDDTANNNEIQIRDTEPGNNEKNSSKNQTKNNKQQNHENEDKNCNNTQKQREIERKQVKNNTKNTTFDGQPKDNNTRKRTKVNKTTDVTQQQQLQSVSEPEATSTLHGDIADAQEDATASARSDVTQQQQQLQSVSEPEATSTLHGDIADAQEDTTASARSDVTQQQQQLQSVSEPEATSTLHGDIADAQEDATASARSDVTQQQQQLQSVSEPEATSTLHGDIA
ncbi:hypothetical protein, conserved, partial [Trypanosoma vivax Y486]